VLPDTSDGEPEVPSAELPTYTVGAWNLEWLHDSRGRGFPENTNGGPSYGPRIDADYQEIAETIRDRIGAKIMVLSEVNGASAAQSHELDRLLTKLGGAWRYFLAPTGGQQRLAILYDSSAARRDRCIEITVPLTKVQDKDIFDRDPLACSFTFLGSGGAARNDLLVVAVHLAAGQHLATNHDSAMALLSRKLRDLTTNGTFSANERDVLIAGDFNASRYDNKIETFWDNLAPTGFQFRTLSPDDGDQYPGTRLAGVPLLPKSQIDYIMASARTGGLITELGEPFAQVRVDLLPTVFDTFRRTQSDHIPVTIRVRIVPDDDS
jgi:endonuclease/exonuclease/phosphatase family metal-dependent hydrolase